MTTGEEKQEAVGESIRRQLAFAVKNVQWSYAIFWSISSKQPGVLEWGEGYYNGDIKTRKTVQAGAVGGGIKADELGLQRTEQLRQLFMSLSVTDQKNLHASRPSSTALSPEDLTHAEWYFLVCMSFVFNIGQGLPGRTLANNKTIWLCNAHQADSIAFTRSLLAKSASIQTVVSFPCLGGVIELGTTEKVMKDYRIIQQIRSSFNEMPYPKLSKISRKPQRVACTNLEQHEMLDNNLDQVEEIEEVNVCSPKNSSNGVEQFQLAADSFIVEGRDLRASQVQSWQFMDDEISGCVHNLTSPSDSILQNLAMIPANVVKKASLDFRRDDNHYQGILSTLFKNTRELILGPQFRNSNRESSFSWRIGGSFGCKQKHDRRGASQVLLKKALFEVAKMHAECLANSPEENERRDRLCGQEADETEASNVLAERRRREKMNQRLSILDSLVPSIGKADKVSVLDSTIEYLKELERRVEELESSMELAEKEGKKPHDVIERTSDNYGKRKACSIDESENENELALPKDDGVIVSISDKKVTIKIRCPWRENLLLKIMGATSNLHLDSYSVQSSNVDGVLSIVIRSKLKSSTEQSEEMIRQALERIIGKCLRHSHWNL